LHRIIVTLTFLLLVSACNLQKPLPDTTSSPDNETPILVQNSSPTDEPTQGTSDQPVTDPTDWQILEEGLAWRTLIPDGNTFAQMNVLRIDPDLYRFRAVYQVGNAQLLSAWQTQLPDVTALINANFFEADNTILGNLVSDGVRYGETFRNTGGTFIVENGIPSIRSNRTQPYQGQPVEQVVEGFPMLVENSQSVHSGNNRAQNTRRTVIAQDSDGNILFIVSPFLGLSLTDLSLYLPTTDLNIVSALNLDGGGSTMMYVQPNDYSIGAFDPVPAVLAVYKR